MDIFHYHPETGVLLSPGKADPSPLESGVWLIPAHATDIEPPEPGDSEQVVMVNGIWELKPIPIAEPEVVHEPMPTTDTEPELTPLEKLERLGLTADDLRAVISALEVT